MEQIVIDCLSEIAKHEKMVVYWTDSLSRYTPPAASPSNKSIVMNLNWHNKKELAFQLAHEMAHILNNDPDNLSFYHATFKGRSYFEMAANEKAIDILMPIYFQFRNREQISIQHFMESLSIPSYLEDSVSKKMKYFCPGCCIFD